MDRIIDILVRRNGRDNFIFLLTCVIGSYDRLIGKNIFISCRPMLVYRMTPVPLRLFHKNLGNLQVFFFGKVVHSLTLYNYHYFGCFIFLQDLKVSYQPMGHICFFGQRSLSLECKPP